MARPMRLGLDLEGEDAEEFRKNRENHTFTPEQLSRIESARRLYKKYRL